MEKTERTITHREHALAQKDADFIKEIMGYLENDGYYETGHAHTMMGDWLAELKKKADLTPTDDPLVKILEDKHALLTKTKEQKQQMLKALKTVVIACDVEEKNKQYGSHPAHWTNEVQIAIKNAE